MAKKEIYLIRHGETDYNLKRIVQGRGVNSDLNETGRSQADAFFNHYRQTPFDIIYFSKLKRTKQTITPFLNLGIPHIETAAIDEIDWGIYEGIEHNKEMHKRYLDIIECWRQGNLEIKIDGGESASDLSERLTPFIEELKSSQHNKILVCAHGRTMRVLLCKLTGSEIKNMDDFPHLNTSLYKLNYDNNRFETELFNNTDHLNAEV